MIIAYGNPKVDIWEAAVDQFIIAIAIFVAIVPEGLPSYWSLRSLGMRNMAKHSDNSPNESR